MSRVSIALVAALLIVCIGATVSVQAVGPCFMTKSDLIGGVKYSASYSTAVITGDPTVICIVGAPVYDFTVNVVGTDGSSGSASGQVCSILSGPMTVTDSAGRVHTFQPRAGQDWGDVHNGKCRNLSWSF